MEVITRLDCIFNGVIGFGRMEGMVVKLSFLENGFIGSIYHVVWFVRYVSFSI
jgi:hypothetical protein